MTKILLELTENNNYKNKFLVEKTCSVLVNKKQGISVNKRR